MKKKIIILSVLVLTFTLCLFTFCKFNKINASEVSETSTFEASSISPFKGTAIDWNTNIDTIYVNKFADLYNLFDLFESLTFCSFPSSTGDFLFYPIWSTSDLSNVLIIYKRYVSSDTYYKCRLHEEFDYFLSLVSVNFSTGEVSTLRDLFWIEYEKHDYFEDWEIEADVDDYFSAKIRCEDFNSYSLPINSFNYTANVLPSLGFNIPCYNEELSYFISSTPFTYNVGGGASEEELEQAYNNGYNAGLDIGFEYGLEDGYDTGYEAGKGVGLTDGYNAGYDAGLEAGGGECSKTHEELIEDAFINNNWHTDLQYQEKLQEIENLKIQSEENYHKGYNDATIDEESFKDMVFSIIEAPFKVIKEALNFEIFGINISGLVLFLITGALIIFVLKIFL